MNPLAQILETRNYMPKCLKIRTKKGTLEPFKINDAQETVLQKIEEIQAKRKPVKVIVLKARQLGISTFAEGYIFKNTATKKLRNAQIVAHEDSASQNLYGMYKTFYDNLPPELTPMQKYSNAQELLFENPTTDINEKRKNPGLQSRVRVSTAKNVNTGRSFTIHYLHASEVAFWADAKTLMTGLMQAVPNEPDTLVMIESTANGVGGYFYDLWQKAERGENDFVPIFLPWYTDRGYTKPFDTEEEKRQFVEEVNHTVTNDEGVKIHTYEYELIQLVMEKYGMDLTYEQLNWRRWCIANNLNGDEEQFAQEYPATPEEAFIVSGRPKFNISALRQYLKQCREGRRGFFDMKDGLVTFREDPAGYVEMWKDREKDMFYCIGADVAEGLKDGDYSDAYVGDSKFDVVCSWHGHIDPDLYGKELVKMARYYNDAYLGVEANNHGLTTLKAVQREDYYNIFYMKSYDKIADIVTQKMGWQTNSRTKPLMIDKFAEFLREKWLGIKSKLMIEECLTYVIDDKGSTNAQDGCYDDSVMAGAILLQLLLEGKGESFTPESPEEEGKNRPDEHAYVPSSTYYDEKDMDDENRPEIAI
jgi:hypothetical protein